MSHIVFLLSDDMEYVLQSQDMLILEYLVSQIKISTVCVCNKLTTYLSKLKTLVSPVMREH